MLATFSIDIEESFHAENMKKLFPSEQWDNLPKQLPKTVDTLLENLEHLKIKATFFVLGWSASRNPIMVKNIVSAGHEIASHGMTHRRLTELNEQQLCSELLDSKKLLEDLSGTRVRGFRAPSFSITDNAIQVLKEIGYIYDSSYHPFGAHSNYGSLKKLGDEITPGIYQPHKGFYEIALPVQKASSFELPIGGGAYFRFLPKIIFKKLTLNWLKSKKPLTFYTHPWELESPPLSLKELPILRRIRQTYHVKHGMQRTCHWLEEMQNNRVEFVTCSEMLKTVTAN